MMAKEATNKISPEKRPNDKETSPKTIAAKSDKAVVNALGVWTTAILIISNTNVTILISISKGLVNSSLYKGIIPLSKPSSIVNKINNLLN